MSSTNAKVDDYLDGLDQELKTQCDRYVSLMMNLLTLTKVFISPSATAKDVQTGLVSFQALLHESD